MSPRHDVPASFHRRWREEPQGPLAARRAERGFDCVALHRPGAMGLALEEVLKWESPSEKGEEKRADRRLPAVVRCSTRGAGRVWAGRVWAGRVWAGRVWAGRVWA